MTGVQTCALPISANSWANVIGTYANSYADAVGAGGNAYTVVVGAASNGWANAIGTGGNSYARAVGTAGNSYTVAVGAGGNSYTVQVGAAANGWANTQSVTDRLIANNAAIAANNYAAATYATKGQTMYVGTTALAINRTSAALNLSGVTLFGNANTATLAGTRGTAVSLSGQTVVQWTGIPSGARKIIMGVYGAASGPSAIPQVQVGTGGTYVSSGYTGCTQKTGSVSGLYPTSCIDLDDYGNQYSYYGNLTFTNITGNMWVWSGVFGTLTSGGVGALVATTGGSVTLSGVLDSLQIFNSTGATFTAGTVNIIYY